MMKCSCGVLGLVVIVWLFQFGTEFRYNLVNTGLFSLERTKLVLSSAELSLAF